MNNNQGTYIFDDVAFSYSAHSLTADPYEAFIADIAQSWEFMPALVNGAEVVPFGSNNDLPTAIRKIMDENNLAPGILQREIGLLWGQGARLYREEISADGSEITRKWEDDTQIWDWLNSFEYEDAINRAIIEYKYMQGYFARFICSRGRRIGQGFISRIEIEPSKDVRMEWPASRRASDVSAYIVGDFEQNCRTGMTRYPRFNRLDPFRFGQSMQYYNAYSFARNFYSVPHYYGALNWIKRSSDIPQILKYLTDNTIAVAYHVIVPNEYWEDFEQRIRADCEAKGKTYSKSELETARQDVFRQLTAALAGKRNSGKFFTSVSFEATRGERVTWQIEPIDQKIKDYIEAQLAVSAKADAATTNGMGVHPALSGIQVDGKLSSGSEQLYALKSYIATSTAIPERIVLQAFNQAIRANFPQSPLMLGFYHQIVKREEDVKPANRVNNNA